MPHHSKPLPALELLDALFHYDPTMGFLLRKTGGGGCRAGDKAGYVNKSTQTMRVKVKQKVYEFSRIVWKMYHKEDPGEMFVDHIDRNPMNNRIDNLRLANRQAQNNLNTKLRKDNKTGYKGVTYRKKTGKYIAQINHKGQKIHIGVYETAEEAGIAAGAARARLHGEFASHSEDDL